MAGRLNKQVLSSFYSINNIDQVSLFNTTPFCFVSAYLKLNCQTPSNVCGSHLRMCLSRSVCSEVFCFLYLFFLVIEIQFAKASEITRGFPGQGPEFIVFAEPILRMREIPSKQTTKNVFIASPEKLKL